MISLVGLPALAAGATIVIPEPMAVRDPALLSKLTRDERVTIWNSVPALMEIVKTKGYDPPEMYCLKDQVKAKYNQPYFPEHECRM